MNYLHFVGIAQVTFEEGFPIWFYYWRKVCRFCRCDWNFWTAIM